MRQDIQYTFKGIIIWIICALFFLYEFLLRTVIGTFQHPIMLDLGLTSFKFALLSTTTYLLIYGPMQIPVGVIVDRLGLKKSLTFASIICALATIGFAYTNSYPSAILFRMLTAFGSSFGFICLLVAVFDWLPNRNFALLIGVSQFIGTIGPMLAAGPIHAIAENSIMSWRYVYIYLGAIGFVLSVLILLLVENNKMVRQGGAYIILSRPESIRTVIKTLFSKLQPWSIAFYSGLIYFAIEYLSENEGKIFIALKGHSPYFASYAISIAWLGFAIGSPMFGYLSDYLHRRKKIMSITAVLYLVSILIIMFAEKQFQLLIGFFTLGISAGSISIGFANIAEQFKQKFMAVAFGVNNTVIMIVGATNAPLISAIIDTLNSLNDLSIKNYQIAFSVLIAAGLSAIILSLFVIKESFCKSTVDFTYLKRS